MTATAPQTLDKATDTLAAELDKQLALALREIVQCTDATAEAEMKREHAALGARLASARKLPAAKAGSAIKGLIRPIQDFARGIEARVEAASARRLRRDSQRRLELKVTESMLAVGRVDDPELARPLVANQRRHRDNLGRIEAIRDDWKAFKECEAAIVTLDAFLVQLADARGVAEWIRGTWRPATARTATAIRSIRDDRCRKNLNAELGDIEAVRAKAMAAGDVRGAKQRPMFALKELDKVVATIQALSPAIDREFDRLEAAIRRAGLATTLGESLRALRQHKEGGWPRASTAADMAREMASFETAVSRFAALVAKEAAAAAKRAKA